MSKFTEEELSAALREVSSTISKCEKMHPKFDEGTSQHTLLKHRIKAMYISEALIKCEDISEKYSQEDLIESLRPVISIINKCEKAQMKFEDGTPNYRRLNKLIDAMYISKSLIDDEISRRD